MIGNIHIGDLEVLDSGSVTSTDGRDVVFNITPNLTIRVVFTEVEGGKQNMNIESKDKTTLVITLQNFNNPLGTEFTKPVIVGTYNSKTLLIHLKVIGMHQSKNRTVIYTWMLDSKNDVKEK